MGRRTYDGFAPIWPTRSGDADSDHINAMPEYVVSTTLKGPEVDETVVSSTRTSSLSSVGFRLADVTTLRDGIVILSYQTDKALGDDHLAASRRRSFVGAVCKNWMCRPAP